MFIAFDPGHTTGWAVLGPEGFPMILDGTGTSMGQVAGQQPLRRFLRAIQTPPRVIIYERFLVDGDMKKHMGEEHKTIQNIGIIKSWYFDLIDDGHEVELVPQLRTVKKMGYGWGNLTQNSNHKESHRRDAMAHAVYYVVKNNIRPIVRRKNDPMRQK